ncbi:SO_0444 family Cu/Zn efflux transporter [bacterium]|nr:SO_0444 family Cu/Zn efflux transporter [bacterium]
MVFEYIHGIIYETYFLFREMAFYLLLGFFFAGVIHIFFPTGIVYKHLGKRNFWSVIKASLVGIPLPLCSCGVLPTAISLRKQGASKASTLSFLISTPTSGIDSIFATYSLLGIIFAVFRVIGSFITAFVAGISALFFTKNEKDDIQITCADNSCNICELDTPHTHSLSEKLRGIFKYGFFELIEDAGKWVAIGVLIGGIINYLIPEQFLEKYLGSNFLSMLVMLVIGIPIYVCATGSIPIVAALLLKGLSPGAGFVFLLAGPATNATSLTILVKYLGKKVVAIYLVSIAVCGIILGYLLNISWEIFALPPITGMMMHGKMIPDILKLLSAIILALLIITTYVNTKIKRIKRKGEMTEAGENILRLKVPGMSCQHCVSSIKNALSKLENVKSVVIDLDNKIVDIEYDGEEPEKAAIKAIEEAGYEVEN